MNTLKVGLLLTVLTVLFVGVGDLIGGQGGMLIAFGFAMLTNIGSYWFSDKIVLKMYKAREASQREAPQLYEMVQRLCEHDGLPMPKLYIVDDPQPNAFATGRDPRHAAVAVNTGLLELLNQPEIEGVIAHELSHVKHRDTLTMSVVATLAGAVMMLAQMAQFAAYFGGGRDDDRNPLALLAAAIVAPIAATMIQMMVSRSREFEADAGAARLIGTPFGLISALGKLERGSQTIPSHANPQTAHMFIVNPFGNLGGAMAGLFRTHPSTADRIAALQALSVR